MSNRNLRIGERLLRLAAALGRDREDASAAGRLTGHWVALAHCRYEGGFDHPMTGRVIDSDVDLAELCSRLRSTAQRRCVVLLCDDDYELDGDSTLPTLRHRPARTSVAA